MYHKKNALKLIYFSSWDLKNRTYEINWKIKIMVTPFEFCLHDQIKIWKMANNENVIYEQSCYEQKSFCPLT